MKEDLNDVNWEKWFEAHSPRLLLYARQWTRTPADAEDALQDGFIRFWRHQRSLRGDPLALVLTSIKRSAYDLARARSRRVLREESASSEAVADNTNNLVPWFKSGPNDEERSEEVELAIRCLPDDQKKVLVLKIWGGFTFAQIASELGISPNTAASRYQYALAGIRRQMNPVERHGCPNFTT